MSMVAPEVPGEAMRPAAPMPGARPSGNGSSPFKVIHATLSKARSP